jgi:hypothetical protein
MEYDNNLIGMVYSDLHAKRDESKIFWEEDIAGATVKKPIFEIDIQKNKISDYKGTFYYKFSPEHSKFAEVSGDEVQLWKSEYNKALKQLKDKKFPDQGENPFMASPVESY